MKKTRYILIALSLIIAAVTIAVLTSVSQIATMEADGYAVTGSANIKQALTKGEDVTQKMEQVHQDDTIYASALGYYVGTNRTPIDRNYPIYMNDGQTLRFLDDDQWLVSTELKLLQTYNGLYLNDGYTYNRDLTQADGDEFLLLALNNGLYINAQKAIFSNSQGNREIPLNSICYFNETLLRWYHYENGKLAYENEDSVGGATITIGRSKFTYEEFLRALNLIQDKIDDKPKPDETLPVETETVDATPETTDAVPLQETSAASPEGGGNTRPTEAKIEDEEIFYLGEVVEGDRVKKTGISESGTGDGKAKDIPSGNRNANMQEADDIADSDREEQNPGGDIPSTDRHSSSGRTTPGGGSSGSGKEPVWRMPEISLSNFKTWMYALDATLNYTDTANALSSSVIVSVYKKINFDGTDPSEVEIKKDAQGHKVYPYADNLTAYSASELDLLGRASLIGTQEFAISPLEPGSTVYVQYSYEYKRQSAQTATKVFSDFTEIKLDDFDAEKLVPVLATWDIEEAEFARKFAFHDLRLVNDLQLPDTAANGGEEEEEKNVFDFEEFKKDSLPYFAHMSVELYNETTGEPLHMPMNDTYVKVAKKKEADYNSRAELTPGCVYTYQVYGTDDYGNVFPLKIQTADMPMPESYLSFQGILYTRKEAPDVSVRFDDITKDTARMSIVILDEYDVMIAEPGLQVYMKDKDGKTVKMTGTLKQIINEKEGKFGPAMNFTNAEEITIPLTPGEVQGAQFRLELTGLTPFTNYIMKVDGTYDPNLTIAGHETKLSRVKETLVSQSFWSARESKDYNYPTAILEGVEAVSTREIKGNLWIIDDLSVMPSGTVVTVYDGVRAVEKSSSQESRGTAAVTGKSGTEKSYDKNDYTGIHILNRVPAAKDGEVKIGELVPGSKAYVQLSYNVIYLEDGHQLNATVQSNLLEVTVPEEPYSLNTVTVSWDEGFATGERSFSFDNITFSEASAFKSPVSSLEKLLDYLEVTLTPVTVDGEPVVVRMTSDVIDRAKRRAITYDSGKIKELRPDTMYTYSVRGYRWDGTELPLQLNPGGRGIVKAGEKAGYIYTCKQKPAVSVAKSQNAFGKINLALFYDDPNEALLMNHPITFRLYEVERIDAENSNEIPVPFSGKLDGTAFSNVMEMPLGTDPEHTMELTGLEIGKTYRISVEGSYCLQPTAKASDMITRLPDVTDVQLVPAEQRDFKAERGTQPVVKMTDIEPWIYAVGAKLEVEDPSGTITGDGITVLATDENGKELYKQRYGGTQEFAIFPLEPGSRVFISYSFKYVDPASKETIPVQGDPVFVELLPLGSSQIDELRGCWNEVFASSDSAVTFENIKFYNSGDYEKEPDEFTFENFKKNVLLYLDRVDVEFTPVGAGERVSVAMTSGTVSWAKMEETDESDISLTTKKGLMQSNRKYNYKVTARDLYGNVMPMKVSVNESKFEAQEKFTGTVYTAKKAPTVKISEVENLIGSMKLHVEVTDTDASIVDGTALEFSIRDKDGVIQLSGDIAGQIIDETNFGPTSFRLSGSNSYDILIDNLELGYHYTAQVRGSYDPQPDEKPREDGYDLDLFENSLLGKKNFIANDGDLTLPGQTGEEGTDPEQLEKGTFVGYIEPKVTMGDLEPWVYAVGSSMDIFDPTATIENGVTAAVFSGISGTKKSTPNAKGQRVYQGVSETGAIVNEGVDPLIRKNVRDSGELALGTIKPGSTVYVQYYYTYYETKIKILVDPVTRRKTVDTNEKTKKTFMSDITQVKLPAIKDGGLASITGSWTGDFAVYPEHFSMSNVSFKNSSGYDPNPEIFTFENYKKNTVGYLNDMQMTLRKLDASGQETGSPITVPLTSSLVSRAISASGGVSFTSSASLLEPDSVYSYTVKGVDIYGLELPMTVKADGAETGTDSTVFKGKLYTRKDIPAVTQTVTENTSGLVTLKITLDDVWKSLEKDSAVLTIYDALTMKTPVILGGTVNGEPIPEGATSLQLKGSENNEYTVILNTLDFYAGYGARVTGSYDPQPTNAPEGKKVDKETGVLFSEMYFQTAEMASGTVYYGITTEKITSDSGTVRASMTYSSRYPTAKAPVGIINRIHFKVAAKDQVAAEFDVLRSELEGMRFESKEVQDRVISSVSTDEYKVYVSGAPRTIDPGVVDENLWQALMGRWNQEDVFINPLPLKVVFEKGALTSMTEYTVTATPFCDRPNSPGREVRNGLSTGNKFSTMKKDPVLVKNEFLLAGSTMKLMGAYVLDEDNAINGSFATVELTNKTNGSTLVLADTLPVLKTKPTGTLSPDQYKDLEYTDLLYGEPYFFEVYTSAYDNTVAGATPSRFQIEGIPFNAGEKFEGDLNLESLEYDTSAAGRKTLLDLSPEECAERIAAGGYFTNAHDTGYLPLATDAEGNPITINASQTIAITTEMPLPVAAGSYHLIYYYNASKSQINYQYCYRGGSTWIVPANAVYYRIVLPNTCSFAEIGIKLSYTTARKLSYTDSTDETWKSQRTTHYHSRINAATGLPETNTGDWSSLYMLATKPGTSYVFRTYTTANYGDVHTSTMFFYNADKKLVSTRAMNAQVNYLVTVPEGISYISYEWSGYSDANNYALYQVGDENPVSANSYQAKLHVELKDLENYLYSLKAKGAGAWLKVEKMDSIRQTERGEEYTTAQEIPVEFDESGYVYEADKLLSGLAANTQWKVSLIAKCKIGGTDEDPVLAPMTLDSVSFQTDAEYELIHNRNEMKKIRRNPYGNYLVVNDFVNNVSAYDFTIRGVVDFQGHVVTYNASSVTYLASAIGPGGVLRNLVMEYPASQTEKQVRPIVSSNYGTMDNIVVRITGEYYKRSENYDSSFLVYNNYGVIRNFIFQMQGDLHVERVLNAGYSYSSLLMYQNFGTLEDWYFFGENNAKLIVGNLPKQSDLYVEGDLYLTLIRGQYGIVKNGFTKFDLKIYTPPYVGSTSFNIFRNESYSDNMSNYYHVGDYTLVDTAGTETQSYFERILYTWTSGSNTLTNGKTRNFWHLTDVDYTSGLTGTSYAKKANVRNVNWQQSVLVEGFDISENIRLGYYPRLKFNDCMKKHQPYIPLDVVVDDSSVPTFMSAELLGYTTNPDPAASTEQFSAGQIRLYFRNQSYDTITDVVITGLTVDSIQRQEQNLAKNLYEVDLNVHIDPALAAKGTQGYLSSYTLDTMKTKSKGNVLIEYKKKLDGIRFYKTIHDEKEWTEINMHMNWNYRLNRDLTFGSSTVSGVGARIFGTNINSQAYFTGTIDGNGYTLYGLEIEDATNANIIYGLSSGTVTNLTVDGMKLSLTRYPTQSRIGFIGYTTAGVMDDVHIRNSELRGFGYVGAVVGYMDAYSRLTNCSAIDTYIGDVKTDTESFVGGLTGYGYCSLIASCYVRGVEIHPELCTNIHGVGGIVGRAQGTTIQDCYTTGKITGTGYNVGGIVGNYIDNHYCHYESLWSRMTIDMDGDFIGGFAGRSNGSGDGLLTMGDIYVDGIHVHRGNGYSNNANVKSRMVAYSGQKIPGITSLNKDDCYMLATPEDLVDWAFWADQILLDENWDLKECWDGTQYRKLQYFPKVYKYSEKELEPGQSRELVRYQDEMPIFLPGQGGEYVLTVSTTDYVSTPGSFVYDDKTYSYAELYSVEMTLDHPGVTHEVFKQYYEDCKAQIGGKLATDVINIDGMDMLDPDQTVVSLTPIPGKDSSTKILIYNFTTSVNDPVYTKALDLYRLTVHYEDFASQVDETLIADIVYADINKGGEQKINYWRISNLNEWRNTIGLGNHGKTKENFLITGDVNFGGGYGPQSANEEKADTYRNLQINRLDGENENCKISNLYYTTNAEADPWIASIVSEINGLTFENCTGDLSRIKTLDDSTATIAKAKTRNGVIFAVRDIKNCTFDGIRTIVGPNTCGNSAFIMIGYGSVSDTQIRNLYYDTTDLNVNDFEYAAGFMCWLQGGASNITAEKIHVVAPRTRYVGGVFCMVNHSKWASQSLATEVAVSGNRLYGGTVPANAGSSETDTDDIPEGESIVRGYRFVGGLASHIYEGIIDNTIGRHSDVLYVEGLDRVGGLAYYATPYVLNSGHPDGVSRNTLVNIHVTSTERAGYTGGLIGYVTDAVDKPFEANKADGIVVTAKGGYTGGLYGYLYHRAYPYMNVVVNSTIQTAPVSGKENTAVGVATGGIAGIIVNTEHIYGCVVRNSSITGPRNVGGILGNQSTYNGNYYISYCYVAEDVTVTATNTENSNAGGIVGYAKVLAMNHNACGASVNAAGKNAGGLVGYLSQHKDDAPYIQQCYFIGSVTGTDYVGGVIGYNMNNVQYSVVVDNVTETRYQTARFLYNGNKSAGNYKDRGLINGVFVGGTLTATGAAGSDGKPAGEPVHVSYGFNNMKETNLEEIGGDNPKIYVWDQTVINGVTVNTEKRPYETELIKEPAAAWLSAASFRDKSYYTSTTAAGFSATYMDFSPEHGVLSEYMPFTKYSRTSGQEAVMPYEMFKSYDEQGQGIEPAGIRLPDYGPNPNAVQVYASGVSTVNIEVTEHQPVAPLVWGEDYIPVEYIQSVGGKSYIMTDYAGQDPDLLVDCKFTDVANETNYLYGQMQAHGSMIFNGMYRNYQLEYNWANVNFTANSTVDMKQSFTDDGKVEIDVNGVKKKVNRPTTNDSQKNMLIFACYNTSGNVRYFNDSVRLHSFKMHLGNNEPFMDLRPCVRKADKKAGLYDIVAKKFYPSLGASDFVAGPVIEEPSLTGSGLDRTGMSPQTVYVKFTGEDGTVSAKTYQTNANGVVTVDYDFTSKIAVSTDNIHFAEYTANELRRSVSLTARDGDDADDIWYYLNTDGEGARQLSFGTSTGTELRPEYELPDKYTHVEYIKAEANQYIKTGVKGVAKIEYKILYTPYKTSRQLMGWSGSWATYFGIRDATSELGGKYENGGSVSSTRASLGQPDDVIWDYRLGGTSSLYVNGVSVANVDPGNASMYDLELQLLALSGSYLNYASLYECKVWQNDKLERWFVPVVENYGQTNAVPGMYDLVYGNFYASASKKAFLAGPEVPIPETEQENVVTGTVSTGSVGDPVHIWGDQVLVRSGSTYTVYTLSPNVNKTQGTATVSLTNPKTVTNGTAHAEAEPFLRERIQVEGVAVNADVYKNFTVLGTGVVPARMYVEGTMAYTVSPWENQLYDKVILRDSGNKKYIAVLSEDGGLTANFSAADLFTSGIREISNSFTSNSPFIVVLYKSGALKVLNYETGRLLYSTEKNAGFLSYLTNVLNSMKASVSSDGKSGGQSSGDGNRPAGVQLNYSVMGLNGLSVTGMTAPAKGLSVLAAGSGSLTGANTESGSGQAETVEQGADGNGGGNGGGTIGSAVSGQAGADGTAAGNGTVSTDSTGAVAGQSGTDAAEKTEKKTVGITSGGQEVPERRMLTASAVYIPGAGVLDTAGNVVVPADETEYVPGEGVYAGGELVYEESVFSGNEELTEEITAQALAAAVTMQDEGSVQEAEASEAEEAEAESEEIEAAEAGEEMFGEEAIGEEEAGEDGESEAKVLIPAEATVRNADADGDIEEEAPIGEAEEPEDGKKKPAETADKPKTNGKAEGSGSHKSGENGAAGTGNGGTGGTAAGGTAAGGDNSAAGTDAKNPGGAGGSKNNGPVLLVTGAEKRSQIAAAVGEKVTIMNPVTGKAQEIDTELLFDGDVVSTAEKKAREEAAAEMLERIEKEKAGIEVADALMPQEAAAAAAGGAFAVQAGLGRTLGEEESSGYMLIGLTILLAAAALAVIYFIVISRRRKLLNSRIFNRKKEAANDGNSEEDK